MYASTQDVTFESPRYLKEKMDATSESTQSGATSAQQWVCYCERPMVVRTAHTIKNFGRRFVNCEKLEGKYLVIFLDFHGGCWIPKIFGWNIHWVLRYEQCSGFACWVLKICWLFVLKSHRKISGFHIHWLLRYEQCIERLLPMTLYSIHYFFFSIFFFMISTWIVAWHIVHFNCLIVKQLHSLVSNI